MMVKKFKGDKRMYALHIVQGGFENGDKAWLERAARKKLDSTTWVVSKSVSISDQDELILNVEM